MSKPPARLPALFALLAWCALVGVFLGTRDWQETISTRLLDLLPGDEGGPDPALNVARDWATDQQARTTLVLLERIDQAPVRTEVAQAFVDRLRASELFDAAYLLSDGNFVRPFAAEMFAQRLPFLWPQWQADHGDDPRSAAEAAVRELDAMLASPDSFALERIVPQDPLLLMYQWQEGLQTAMPAPRQGTTLIWLENAGDNPLGVAAEQARQAALEEAAATLPGVAADWRVLDTGFPKFSAENERRIRREINWLNLASLGGVVLIAWVFTRRLQLVLEVSLLLGLTLASALAFTILLMGQVHALTLVTGSILAGLAIDYTLHVRLYHYGPEQERELLWRPLLMGAASTLAAFALLLWSELPMLRQLGWFMLGGLISAVALVALYRLVARPIRQTRLPTLHIMGGAWRWAVLVLLVLLLVPAMRNLHWAHDLRDLQYPLPQLEAEQTEILEAAGPGMGSQQLLIGSSPNALIEAVHAMAAEGAEPATTDHWFLSLPTAQDAREAQALAAGGWGATFAETLRQELEEAGYEVEAFEPFFSAWEAYRLDELPLEAYNRRLIALEEQMQGPLSLLTHFQSRDGRVWLTLNGTWPENAPEGTELLPVSQIEHLNGLLAHYTTHLGRYGYIMLGMIAVVLLALQGPRRTGHLLLRLSLAIGLGLGMLAWGGGSLNLFHLLAVFLGVGILLDYGLFSIAAQRRQQPLPPSILMSAATTGYSFAVLSFSRIPAAQALGSVVAFLVFAGLLVVLLLHPQPQTLPTTDEGH
ncbi:MAG: hypothetical protein Q7P63_14770 [Verrucomicrobiota bacterium JB022]|nr:hypothetical protein [Verrucomicrobiota bacterium JB022]